MINVLKIGAPGLTLIDLSSAQSAVMYRVNKTGLYIYESTNSELKSGDRITAVDGIEIADQASFCDYSLSAVLTGISRKLRRICRGGGLNVKTAVTKTH